MSAQTDWYRLLSGTIKAGKAYMITDEQLAESVKGEVAEMDRQNTVCASGSKYAQRLRRITKGMKDADGIELNFKVYKTTEYNAEIAILCTSSQRFPFTSLYGKVGSIIYTADIRPAR